MTNAFIYDGARTAFGRHAGCLSGLRPDDLLASVIKTLLERTNFDSELVEDVIVGNTNQAGEDCRNVARFASLLAGLPIETGGQTVNRLCGSGLAAAADAARCIKVNEGNLFVAGGVESMSRAPLVISKAVTAFDRGQQIADSTIGARFLNPRFAAEFGADTMPETADNVAADLGISREACDSFAAASQAKYDSAMKEGFFQGEILPVEVITGRKTPPATIQADEHPRPGSTVEALSRLRPLSEGGVVTAGNASGVNDGAAALLIGNEKVGVMADQAPRGRILATAVAGVEPRIMGLGPVPASRKALERAGLTIDDMAVLEFNEAFAAQVLGCLKQLDISFDDPRVNPNGGAIAIGHPLGASGARILLTALRQLERTQGRYGLVTMCIGIGQGIAVVIERVDQGAQQA